MVVLDTTVLVYATSDVDDPIVERSKRLIDAIGDRLLRATTTAEVIQEFAHVRGRLRDRPSAVRLARRYIQLLSPLLIPDDRALDAGLSLFERHPRLGGFDAILAAASIAADADALVSTDGAFADVRRLRHVDPATPALDALLAH